MYLKPEHGGCWFCSTDNEGDGIYWMISWEFDTVAHHHCLYKALKEGNEEAKIMYREILWGNF